MKAPICGYFRLHFKKNPIAVFFPLMQQGFFIEITTENLLKLLCRTCGLTPAEVKARIQTVFLNGKPVDDLATATVRDGDSLALSAAMPGLVGATMRSGGVLASFRHSISHRPSDARACVQGGVLSMKLFNLLIKEIGPHVLQNGIVVESDIVRNLLRSGAGDVERNCVEAQLDDGPIDVRDLKTMQWPVPSGLIRLAVTYA